MAIELQSKDLANFDSVMREVQRRADHNLPDKVIDLKKVEFLESGRVYVPELGMLQMNHWSKDQLSQMVGVDWDRWFLDSTAKEIQEEMLRRLSRRSHVCLVRARRHFSAKPSSEGVLRAFLSPAYEPIDDIRVFDRLRQGFRDQVSNLLFVKARTQETDRSSHFTILTGDVFDAAPGRKESVGDPIYFGIKVRNSETGFSALTADDFTIRIRCLNGLITYIRNNRLLYRRHKRITDENIDGLLTQMFSAIPERQSLIRRQWESAQRLKFDSEADTKEVLARFLDRQKQSLRLIEAAKVHFDREPMCNGYGVLNAITAAAREVKDLDRRQELEAAAGKYLMGLSS